MEGEVRTGVRVPVRSGFRRFEWNKITLRIAKLVLDEASTRQR